MWAKFFIQAHKNKLQRFKSGDLTGHATDHPRPTYLLRRPL